MPRVLATKGISHTIDDIIAKANEYILIISPFIRISRSFLDRLHVASNRGISITIVYGKKKLTKNQEEKIYKLKNCRILYNQNLHAKVYVNEQEGIITSMNLYDSSEHYNYELGVQFEKEFDTKMYDDNFREIQHIIECSDIKREANTITGKELEDEHIETILNTKSKLKITDYPVKGITITKDYGFITFCINEQTSLAESQWKELQTLFNNELRDYRVYCKSKLSRIYIYYASNIQFRSQSDERKYTKEGIEKSFYLLNNFLN